LTPVPIWLETTDQARPDRVFIALHAAVVKTAGLKAFWKACVLPYTASRRRLSALGNEQAAETKLWAIALGPAPTPRYGVLFCDKVTARPSSTPWQRVDRQALSTKAPALAWPRSKLAQLEKAWGRTAQAVRPMSPWSNSGDSRRGIYRGHSSMARPLRLIACRTPHTFYDTNAKYLTNDTSNICHAG